MPVTPLRHSAFPAVALLCLIGCQTAPPTAQAPSPVATDAGLDKVPRCADRASATLAEGVRIGYLGGDPDDPQRCLVSWLDRSHALYFGFWSSSPSSPMSEEARAAVRSALTGPVGTKAAFEARHAQMWDRVTVTHIANPLVDVAGQKRPGLELQVVRYDAAGRPDVQAETRYTIDRATGVLLRRQSVTPMADGGVSRITSWQIDRFDRAG
jgi:hypothetical protein